MLGSNTLRGVVEMRLEKQERIRPHRELGFIRSQSFLKGLTHH
jgi:hypothetical protein